METVGSDDEEIPTLATYKSFINRFSIEAIRTRLAARRRVNTRPGPAVQAELKMINEVYRKSILLVSWAGGISEGTANSFK